MPTKSLNLAAIRIDGGTQSRVAINQDAVAEYAQVITEGDTLPAITVFFDGADYWLADGFHRLFANKSAGKASVLADVLTGTCRDAILYSLAANTVHGLRPTNEDKRKAVGIMLADPEWSLLTAREIAKHCGVSHTLVLRMQKPEPTASEPAKTKPASGTSSTASDDRTPNAGTCSKPEPTAKQAEAEQNAQDAHGDTDPVAMWEAAEKQVVVLQKELDAAQADDAKAEIIKWKRIADLAQRRQNELMDTVNQREKELQRLSNILRRIGKALDEDDTSKLAAMVEALVRKVK
jgi:uncharacterized ParB-like nuclease family protein